MKKIFALLVSLVLLTAPLACIASGEEARFVTVREWLDAKGECGDCMLLLKITQIFNPVLAAAADDTGAVNLFSGNGEDSMIVNFMSDECPPEGAILVVANPRYNVFEGSVEMADWTLLRIMRDPAPGAAE